MMDDEKKKPCFVCELADLRIRYRHATNDEERDEIKEEIDRLMAREKVK